MPHASANPVGFAPFMTSALRLQQRLSEVSIQAIGVAHPRQI